MIIEMIIAWVGAVTAIATLIFSLYKSKQHGQMMRDYIAKRDQLMMAEWDSLKLKQRRE